MSLSDQVNLLFEQERWQEARHLLEQERIKKPDSHWVLTQLAATFCEDRHYDEAMKLLSLSFCIHDDCPLTTWYLAGTLVALNQIEEAKAAYIKIINMPIDNPCWESKTWRESLKLDSSIRLEEIG